MQRGFTLIEILIAMAIFTLIGLASTNLLTTVLDSNELSIARFEKLQRLQRAMIIIERDIQQVVPRAVRVNGEMQSAVMSGGNLHDNDGQSDGLTFVRSGWQNPQYMLPRSGLQLVSYRVQNDTLERMHSHYVDNVIGAEPITRVLLENVTDLNVEFIERSKEITTDKHSAWSENYQAAELPKAIAIEITSEEFGVIRREFTLSGSNG